ncbi:MAG: TetR/AcrR family transcriptional regulator [Frankia sp.]
MTDSAGRARPSKRDRLIASATELLHQQGVQSTTLAQIAAAADVPPGNVYYYFKTRDDLVRAVVDARAQEISTALASFEELPDPPARFRALMHLWSDEPEVVARYGCPIGTLNSELGKCAGDITREASTLVALVVDWAEAQFRDMGRADAPELAITFFATVQGAVLIAHALRDPDVVTNQVRRLEDWIASLA